MVSQEFFLEKYKIFYKIQYLWYIVSIKYLRLVVKNMEFKKDFKNLLKKLRTEKRLTQKALADKIDIPVSMISKYEQGTNKPSFSYLSKICRFFEVELDYFLVRGEQQNDYLNLVLDILNDKSDENFLSFIYPTLEFISKIINFEYEHIGKMFILKFENKEIKITEENLKKVLELIENDMYYNFSKYLNLFEKKEN
jgi:toxin-antitoxin system, antitoxin component, xre family